MLLSSVCDGLRSGAPSDLMQIARAKKKTQQTIQSVKKRRNAIATLSLSLRDDTSPESVVGCLYKYAPGEDALHVSHSNIDASCECVYPATGVASTRVQLRTSCLCKGRVGQAATTAIVALGTQNALWAAASTREFMTGSAEVCVRAKLNSAVANTNHAIATLFGSACVRQSRRLQSVCKIICNCLYFGMIVRSAPANRLGARSTFADFADFADAYFRAVKCHQTSASSTSLVAESMKRLNAVFEHSELVRVGGDLAGGGVFRKYLVLQHLRYFVHRVRQLLTLLVWGRLCVHPVSDGIECPLGLLRNIRPNKRVVALLYEIADVIVAYAGIFVFEDVLDALAVHVRVTIV